MSIASYPYLSFALRDEFIAQFEHVSPNWAFPAGGGNTFGEITYLTKYSRVLEPDINGVPFQRKERWFETCRRVVEGVQSILKNHCKNNHTPWNEQEAQDTAEEMYVRLFEGKWMPPGRGLWMMGTQFVERWGSAALQNCAFLSTAKDPNFWAPRLMEMSMLGIGVGFDTRGKGMYVVQGADTNRKFHYEIPDSREGWAESLTAQLNHHFHGAPKPIFDYSKIREAGAPIKGFGGTSAGPDPLRKLHNKLDAIFSELSGNKIDSHMIVDISNLIGKAVVAANVRSSAEIALDEGINQDFLELKNWEKYPERMGPDGWGYTSNNSVMINAGQEDFSQLAPAIALNGEPGIIWLDVTRTRGRLADPYDDKDANVMGFNPCAEQPLEDLECCTLCETFPVNCDSKEDYMRTLKFAFMYSKAVTLLPTHWEDTNAVMVRNRRIGTGMTGVALFVERYGWNTLREWSDAGYQEIRKWDNKYSRWLGVRESNRVTTIKPSGTVALLIAKPGVIGNTPGVHWPVASGEYVRTMRLGKYEPMLEVLTAANYKIEPNYSNPELQSVVYLPVNGPNMRAEQEVTIWEKTSLATHQQHWWSDNAVSYTGTFAPEEADDIASVLRVNEGKLKCISFLPVSDTKAAYPQMPYSKVPHEEWQELADRARPIEWSRLYEGNVAEATGELYCTTDVCEIKDYRLDEQS